MPVTLADFHALNIETQLIGLEKPSPYHVDQFCTPRGSVAIGWENSICYCLIDGFGETVFAVNPESCADSFVYPLAEDLEQFLRLVLACGSTTVVEQIVWWTREQFDAFLVSDDNAMVPGQQEALDSLALAFGLEPAQDPYSYVKGVQAGFDGSALEFSDEYYDVLGLEPPDGRSIESELVEFVTVAFAFEEE